jgi:TM2 domain-containing membrane protein YozV
MNPLPALPSAFSAEVVSHFLFLDGQQQGPFSMSQLQGMWRSGAITRETLHFMDGYTEWMPLEIIVPDLEPAPLPQRNPAAYPPRPVVVAKSRGIYIILGLFLGGLFGVHNFYAGRFTPGIFQLLITIFTFWLILPLFLVAIWVILELCLVTKDGKGHPFA